MATYFILKLVFVITISSVIKNIKGQQLVCETEQRRPEGYFVNKTAGDGGFRILIVGPQSETGFYVPNEIYTG